MIRLINQITLEGCKKINWFSELQATVSVFNALTNSITFTESCDE